MTDTETPPPLKISLFRYREDRKMPPVVTEFAMEETSIAMMTAMTYAILDTRKEFTCYEVVSPFGILIVRVTPRWIYDPS